MAVWGMYSGDLTTRYFPAEVVNQLFSARARSAKSISRR